MLGHELSCALQIWVSKVGSVQGEDPFSSSDGRLQVQLFIQSHRHNLSWGAACEQVAGLNTSTTADDTAPVRPHNSRGLLLPGRQAFILQVVQEKVKWQLHK
jgi:hypothetical protein